MDWTDMGFKTVEEPPNKLNWALSTILPVLLQDILQYLVDNLLSDYMPVLLTGQAQPGTETVSVDLILPITKVIWHTNTYWSIRLEQRYHETKIMRLLMSYSNLPKGPDTIHISYKCLPIIDAWNSFNCMESYMRHKYHVALDTSPCGRKQVWSTWLWTYTLVCSIIVLHMWFKSVPYRWIHHQLYWYALTFLFIAYLMTLLWLCRKTSVRKTG